MKGTVVWFTGLPASGKTTLAEHVAARLRARGRVCALLDGDAVREVFVPPHGFDDAGRADHYRTLGGLAVLLASQGLVVLVAATGHKRAYRSWVRDRAPRFLEVHLTTKPDECAARDPKGLWRERAAGHVVGLPDAESYEPPEKADVAARGGEDLAALEAIDRLIG